jgi:hypothetical protein
MVGLVFAESLRLTFLQWVAVGLNTAGWLWCYCNSPLEGHLPSIPPLRRVRGVFPGNAGILPTSPPLRGAGGCFPFPGRVSGRYPETRKGIITALLTFIGLWIAFWNESTSIDQQVLFEQARYLSRFPWTAFLEEFAHRPYVEYQPPFFTFWLSRIPVLWFHQIMLFPFGLLCVGLMWKLYGRQTALLCATPMFALMIHQSSTDTILFGMVLIVLRLRQLSRYGKGVQKLSFCCQSFALTLLAVFFYGLTWMIKPLTLLTVPFIMPQLGIAGIGSLAMWGGYIFWSQQWEFGCHQFYFLLQQVLIRSVKTSKKGQGLPRVPLTLSAKLHKLLRTLQGSLRWRWRHLGRKAVIALPFYLFPAWLWPWTWKGIILTAVIILAYGNSKYLLLDLLFLFPVREEAESMFVFR